MNQHEHITDRGPTGTAEPQVTQQHAATQHTADERTRQWTFRAISPGDSHIKGELSLCVGEAA